MESELSPDSTEPYIRNSLRQNSGHPATFKQMWFTRFLGSISAVLSCLVFPPREVIPRTAAGNRAYKIPCNDCNWSYIGETGRCLQTRKKEHIRNVKYCNKGSNVANHAWMNDHQIDFKNARVIDKGDYRVRKTLESWHTAMTTEADNNARSLPRQYSILLK